MTELNFCNVCGFKTEEKEVCPNCHNRQLVKTAPPVLPKRVDLLKDEEVDDDI